MADIKFAVGGVMILAMFLVGISGNMLLFILLSKQVPLSSLLSYPTKYQPKPSSRVVPVSFAVRDKVITKQTQ